MSYAYHSSTHHTPSEDPVRVDTAARTVTITVPGAHNNPDWTARFPLHSFICCKRCHRPVTLYVDGAAPPEMLRHSHLISHAWQHGFWRILPHRLGFVLTASQHPYTVTYNGQITGSCDESETEVAFLASLPTVAPQIPVQPLRLPAHLRPVTALPAPAPAESEPATPAPPPPITTPHRRATQLALF
jgi:hypothetical protein